MIRMVNRRARGGYLTVYLALTMAVVLSLCLALIEGVRSNAIRVEAECVAEIGFHSVFAEYHRELFEQYNLFAIDASYGTSASGVDEMARHLQEYMARNFSMEDIFLEDFFYRDFLAMSVKDVEVNGASIFTDEGGAVFRRRAVEAIRDDCNLTLLQELQQWLQVVEEKGLWKRDVASEKHIVDEQLQAYNGRKIQLSEKEWFTVQVQNPTDRLEEIRKKGILKYVVENPDALSQKSVYPESFIQSRMECGQINIGNMTVEELGSGEELLERFFFQEYLLRYMGYYGEEKMEGALSYQVEYLIANNDTDVANMRHVANLLCAIREAANVIYLYSDEEKCMEAEVVATVLATLLQVPEAASLLKNVLLLGWAYAESLYDVEVLLSGGKVPLIKDGESWHYDIENALSLKSAVTPTAEEGLGYEDYLRMMLVFVDLDTLTSRAMNMVEADIRLTPGNAFFRLDNCYDKVEFCIEVESKYGYEYEITRVKGYQ